MCYAVTPSAQRVARPVTGRPLVGSVHVVLVGSKFSVTGFSRFSFVPSGHTGFRGPGVKIHQGYEVQSPHRPSPNPHAANRLHSGRVFCPREQGLSPVSNCGRSPSPLYSDLPGTSSPRPIITFLQARRLSVSFASSPSEFSSVVRSHEDCSSILLLR